MLSILVNRWDKVLTLYLSINAKLSEITEENIVRKDE